MSLFKYSKSNGCDGQQLSRIMIYNHKPSEFFLSKYAETHVLITRRRHSAQHKATSIPYCDYSALMFYMGIEHEISIHAGIEITHRAKSATFLHQYRKLCGKSVSTSYMLLHSL